MKRMVCLIGCLFLCLSLLSCQDTREGTLTVHFFDVGQGDSTLLRTEVGDILIDAGTEDSQDLLSLRLEALGVRELALLIISHPDEDHLGGADGVLENIPTKGIWINGAPLENDSAKRMLAVAEEKGIPIKSVSAGDTAQYGETRLSVLSPIRTVGEGGNEGSIMLRVQYGRIRMILTGDAGVEQEEELVRAYGAAQLDCELYKVGHHGSNTSSGMNFLHAMSPDYAVIMCGGTNSYGHPFGEVLARLKEINAEILRTDLVGEIVFKTDGECLTYVGSHSK